MRSFALDDLAVGCEKFTGHHTKTAEALCENVALDITVVVFGGPDESARRLDCLCNHVVDEPVFIVNPGLLIEGFILTTRLFSFA